MAQALKVGRAKSGYSGNVHVKGEPLQGVNKLSVSYIGKRSADAQDKYQIAGFTTVSTDPAVQLRVRTPAVYGNCKYSIN
jgi:hypothetical protein